MDSKDLDKDIVDFLLSIYKSLQDEEAKYSFVRKAEENLNIKGGQLLQRMELELVWEDFNANGVDSEYDPDKENTAAQEAVGTSANVETSTAKSENAKKLNSASVMKQLLQDGENIDFLLQLLKQPEVFYCKYCKSMGLPRSTYLSHNMYYLNGKIICPHWNSYRYASQINSARGQNSKDSPRVEKCHK